MVLLDEAPNRADVSRGLLDYVVREFVGDGEFVPDEDTPIRDLLRSSPTASACGRNAILLGVARQVEVRYGIPINHSGSYFDSLNEPDNTTLRDFSEFVCEYGRGRE